MGSWAYYINWTLRNYWRGRGREDWKRNLGSQRSYKGVKLKSHWGRAPGWNRVKAAGREVSRQLSGWFRRVSAPQVLAVGWLSLLVSRASRERDTGHRAGESESRREGACWHLCICHVGFQQQPSGDSPFPPPKCECCANPLLTNVSLGSSRGGHLDNSSR